MADRDVKSPEELAEEERAFEKKFRKKKFWGIVLIILGAVLLVCAIVVKVHYFSANAIYSLQIKQGYVGITDTAAYKLRKFEEYALFIAGAVFVVAGFVTRLINKAAHGLGSRKYKSLHEEDSDS